MDCGKKSNLAGFLGDKIAEKSAVLQEFLVANLAGKQLANNGGFCGYFQGKFR